MRLWSVSPKYLDSKGLVALWREGLLAQKVLKGQTRGYKNHPQLERFKAQENPVMAIANYLHFVWLEAKSRGYNFDAAKIKVRTPKVKFLSVSHKQIEFEVAHLKRKLKTRDPKKWKIFRKENRILPHPIFKKVRGEIASWEKI